MTMTLANFHAELFGNASPFVRSTAYETPVAWGQGMLWQRQFEHASVVVDLNFRSASILIKTAAQDGLRLKTDDSKIDCRWTVNDHQHPGGLYGQLSPALRGGFSSQTTSLYPAGSVRLSGFIDYPTELFMAPLEPAVVAATASSCSTVTNNTGTYEGSYIHVAAATIDDCCSACSAAAQCKFALYQQHNPLPTHHCWMMNATTLTPRPQRDTQVRKIWANLAPKVGPTSAFYSCIPQKCTDQLAFFGPT
jgi:hypothetical protein